MEPLCSKACHKSGAMDPTRSQTNFSHNPLQCLLYVIRLTLFLHTFGWNLCMNFSYFSQALHASPVLTLLHHHKAHWTLDIYATTHKRSCLKIKWRHPQTLSQGQISIQSLARANNDYEPQICKQWLTASHLHLTVLVLVCSSCLHQAMFPQWPEHQRMRHATRHWCISSLYQW